MGEHVRAGNLDMWVERRGRGPDVLLIAGLGDPAEACQFQLDGLADRYRLTAYDNRGMGRTPDTVGRLSQVTVPALVPAGGLDMITPPRYGRVVADAIPGARFEILAEEAHQPFQEVPGLFNAKVDAFWRAVEARGL